MKKPFTAQEIARELTAELDKIAYAERDKALAAGATEAEADAAFDAVWHMATAPENVPMVM